MLLKKINYQIYKTITRGIVRVRFAPSPTGRMHIGGLRIAFYNYLFAKKHNGEFLLRIEDTDRERFKADSVDNIISGLKWTKLIPDHGPGFSSDAQQYFQSNRLDHYKIFIQKLLDKNLAYKCYCSEARLELLRRAAIKNQEKLGYDGKCRHLTAKEIEENRGKPYVVRFKLENEFVNFNDLINGQCELNLFSQETDFVLIKSDGYPTNHFANVVDDHLMGITHVLRGNEWLTSTPKHLLLFRGLNLEPPQYAHFPLVLNPDGSKLSKRNNDIDVMSFKERGFFPEALLGYFTTFGGGFHHDCNKISTIGLSKLVELFDLNLIVNRSSKYSEESLLQTNKEVLELKTRSGDSTLKSELRSLLKIKNIDAQIDSHYLSDGYLGHVLNLTMHRISKLSDLLSPDFDYLWHKTSRLDLQNIIETKTGIEKTLGCQLIDALIGFLQGYESIDTHESSMVKMKAALTKEFKDINNRFKKNKLNLWLFYRIILSGNLMGPPIVEIMCILGKENILYRLNNVKKMLEH